ncbi:hypothetical protein Golob_012167 [Gossypium lobatum]|uniref:RRM domain-containing protein n=1 Tax=Gossypium lobatum TaxID=34289 RepID=A0A7J8MS83_9ROSI|nr:hypothetical protein [Gossypium lobatum]
MHWNGPWVLFRYHGEVIDAFIPVKKSKSGRRFGFVRYDKMMDRRKAINRILTIMEKKKRDWALRRQKGKGISDREHADVNASLSNLDISNRKRLILRDARNAWEVRKKLGFSVRGNEKEVVDIIMRLEGL